VIILTSTPSSMAWRMTSLVSDRGGSRNVMRPASCHGAALSPAGPSARAMAMDRMPRAARSVTAARSARATSGLAPDAISEITWGAPLATRNVAPSGPRRSAAVNLVAGSNGVKSSCSYRSHSSRSAAPRVIVSRASRGGSRHLAARAARTRRARRSTPGRKERHSSWTSILLVVRVPVLSEQRRFMPAISSTAARRVTMAPCAASCRDPRARVVVTTTSMATGMDATRTTTVNPTASLKAIPWPIRYPNDAAHMARDRPRRRKTMRLSRRCRLEAPDSTDWIIVAVLPKKVSAPVNCTVASTSPRTTVEPILADEPRFIVAGRDSPVMADWSTSTTPPSTTQSAGTADPDARSTRSPGTTSAASMFCHRPSRFTVASGFRLALRAATASPALTTSWYPIAALTTLMARRRPMSSQFWMATSTTTATQIIAGIGPHSWSRNTSSRDRVFSASSLRPCSASSRRASAGGGAGWGRGRSQESMHAIAPLPPLYTSLRSRGRGRGRGSAVRIRRNASSRADIGGSAGAGGRSPAAGRPALASAVMFWDGGAALRALSKRLAPHRRVLRALIPLYCTVCILNYVCVDESGEISAPTDVGRRGGGSRRARPPALRDEARVEWKEQCKFVLSALSLS